MYRSRLVAAHMINASACRPKTESTRDVFNLPSSDAIFSQDVASNAQLCYHGRLRVNVCALTKSPLAIAEMLLAKVCGGFSNDVEF